MCILPNFPTSDLTELEKKGKKENKKAETVELIVPEQPLLENSKIPKKTLRK
jgi:hypothetical protein